MILQHFAPPPELLPYISGYLYGQSSYSEGQLIPTIPRGLRALMVVMDEDGGGQIEFLHPELSGPLTNGVYLLGQTTQNALLKVGTSRAYMIPLKPVELPWLWGAAANDYTDSLLKLHELIPECRVLADQLLAAKGQLEQLAILDAFLKRLFRNALVTPDEVQGAVQRIMQTQGLVRISEVALQQRVSVRTLTRKFTEQVGLAPKQYAQIIRFRAMMHYLLIAPEAPWLDVVHHFGYYDQSHFIKDFQHFTGCSPSQYLILDQHFDGQFIKALATL